MIGPLRWPGAPVALILIVGIAGSVVALSAREGDSEFAAAQRDLSPVEPGALERLVSTTSDPRPGYRGRALDARCRTHAARALGNPWTCVVRYPRAPLVRYEVTVHANRSISGVGQPADRPLRGALSISGCCVGGT
jgi:hypothetical protein